MSAPSPLPSDPDSRAPRSPGSRPPLVGLPWIAVLGLALLAVPRVILHDLDLVHEGTFVNLLLVFVPLIVWIAVVLVARVERPFTTLLAVGGVHGILLAVTHQLLWHIGMDDSVLRLGGNLAGLSPVAQDVIFRAAAVVSSLLTGLAVGAIAGAVALGVRTVSHRAGSTPQGPPTV